MYQITGAASRAPSISLLRPLPNLFSQFFMITSFARQKIGQPTRKAVKPSCTETLYSKNEAEPDHVMSGNAQQRHTTLTWFLQKVSGAEGTLQSEIGLTNDVPLWLKQFQFQ